METKGWSLSPAFWLTRGLPKGKSLSCLTQHWWEQRHRRKLLKREGSAVACESCRECAAPQAGTKGYTTAGSWEDIQASHSGNNTDKSKYARVRTPPRKALRGARASVQAGWLESRSPHTPWIKIGKSVFFFQMHKTTKHTKKQGNVAQSKGQTEVPETDSKETQISQLSDKEFLKLP